MEWWNKLGSATWKEHYSSLNDWWITLDQKWQLYIISCLKSDPLGHLRTDDDLDLLKCLISLEKPTIPVCLAGKFGDLQCYELSEILDLLAFGRINPLTRKAFTFAQVSPAVDKLKQITEKVAYLRGVSVEELPKPVEVKAEDIQPDKVYEEPSSEPDQKQSEPGKKVKIAFPINASFNNSLASFEFNTNQEAKVLFEKLIEDNPSLSSLLSIKEKCINITSDGCRQDLVAKLFQNFNFETAEAKKDATYLSDRAKNTAEYYTSFHFFNSRAEKCKNAFDALKKSVTPLPSSNASGQENENRSWWKKLRGG